MSETEFLDDARCMVDGKMLVRPFNKLDFINKESKNLIQKNKWESLEDAEDRAMAII